MFFADAPFFVIIFFWLVRYATPDTLRRRLTLFDITSYAAFDIARCHAATIQARLCARYGEGACRARDAMPCRATRTRALRAVTALTICCSDDVMLIRYTRLMMLMSPHMFTDAMRRAPFDAAD